MGHTVIQVTHLEPFITIKCTSTDLSTFDIFSAIAGSGEKQCGMPRCPKYVVEKRADQVPTWALGSYLTACVFTEECTVKHQNVSQSWGFSGRDTTKSPVQAQHSLVIFNLDNSQILKHRSSLQVALIPRQYSDGTDLYPGSGPP